MLAFPGYSDGTFYTHQHIETIKKGRRFLQGDVIGCGLAITTGQLVFTHNGQLDGIVECQRAAEYSMYAKVGLKGDVKVKANFGQEQFRFDVEDFLKVGNSRGNLLTQYSFISDPPRNYYCEAAASLPPALPIRKADGK